MAAYRLPSDFDRQPLQRRASGLGLAVTINLLVLLALLGLGTRSAIPVAETGATLVNLAPNSDESSAPSKEATPPAQEQQQASRLPVPPALPPSRLPVKPTIALPPQPDPVEANPDRQTKLDMIEMTPEDYAAADVTGLARSAPSAGSGSAGDSKAVGRTPSGQLLYAAEWARNPTDTELGGYLPPNPPSGWGLIACRTAPGNRVEDCIELGSSPRGSRLASAVRQAAWQFRVKPPRKNGQPMIGEWVQIRIDYEFVKSR